jgi:YesN/AraC family two-component response regulator
MSEGDCGLGALLAAANYEGEIDILITDLEMPRINGIDYLRSVQGNMAGHECVFIAGSPADSI